MENHERIEEAELHFQRGNALHDLGQLAQAVEAYRRTLELNPAHVSAWVNCGNDLHRLGRHVEALQCYDRALDIEPGHYDARNNVAVVLNKLRYIDAAIAQLRETIRIDPRRGAAYNNLGSALCNAGAVDEGLASYRRAVELDAAKLPPHSNLIYTLYFSPGATNEDILAEGRRFAERHAPQPVKALPRPEQEQHRPGQEKRLRVGYISPDFRKHCQSLFTSRLFPHHDKAAFEVFCYADLAQPDATTERLRPHADVWRFVHGLSDAELADEIRRNGIDILIDLTMHMEGGRPLLYALRPAPVQVAWLAYPGTTALPWMDFRLSDPWLDPPEADLSHYTETTLRLADTFWCYDPMTEPVEVGELPLLRNGYVTFGCLNNFCKINAPTLTRWAGVMRRVAGSRLVLLAPEGEHRQRLLKALEAEGIAPERLEFVPFRPRQEYLQTYRRIDICLDTLPYNGHTTSLDAYWMGVPVVTQVGATIVGRAGWSQLNNLGLPELAAFDEAGFIDIAAGLAADAKRLAHLRATLRARLEASPLMDGPRFARAFEAQLRAAWRHPGGLVG